MRVAWRVKLATFRGASHLSVSKVALGRIDDQILNARMLLLRVKTTALLIARSMPINLDLHPIIVDPSEVLGAQSRKQARVRGNEGGEL